MYSHIIQSSPAQQHDLVKKLFTFIPIMDVFQFAPVCKAWKEVMKHPVQFHPQRLMATHITKRVGTGEPFELFPEIRRFSTVSSAAISVSSNLLWQLEHRKVLFSDIPESRMQAVCDLIDIFKYDGSSDYSAVTLNATAFPSVTELWTRGTCSPQHTDFIQSLLNRPVHWSLQHGPNDISLESLSGVSFDNVESFSFPYINLDMKIFPKLRKISFGMSISNIPVLEPQTKIVHFRFGTGLSLSLQNIRHVETLAVDVVTNDLKIFVSSFQEWVQNLPNLKKVILCGIDINLEDFYGEMLNIVSHEIDIEITNGIDFNDL